MTTSIQERTNLDSARNAWCTSKDHQCPTCYAEMGSLDDVCSSSLLKAAVADAFPRRISSPHDPTLKDHRIDLVLRS